MSQKGRKPENNIYYQLGFDLEPSKENPKKFVAICKACRKSFANKEKVRLTKHREKCKSLPEAANTDPLWEDIEEEDDVIFTGAAPSTSSSQSSAQSSSSSQTNKKNKKQCSMYRYADQVNSKEVEGLVEAIAIFFFACRIPFNIIENFYFLNMLKKLRPGFAPHIPSRKKLSTTLLEKTYKNCIKYDVEQLPEHNALLLDGWKNSVSNEKKHCIFAAQRCSRYFRIYGLCNSKGRRTRRCGNFV